MATQPEPFSEPFFTVKIIADPLLGSEKGVCYDFYSKKQNPSQNPFFTVKPTAEPEPFWEPFPRTLSRTFSEPFLERCVPVRPLRRAPNSGGGQFGAKFLAKFGTKFLANILGLFSGSFCHPQPPSLPILLPEPGSERKVLTKETWFPLLREWKPWKLQWEQSFPRPENFRSRPGCRRKILTKELWGWGGGGKNLILMFLLGHLEQTKKLQQELEAKSRTALHSETGENSGKNFMTRFCRGSHSKPNLPCERNFNGSDLEPQKVCLGVRFAQAFCSRKSFREITLNYSRLR